MKLEEAVTKLPSEAKDVVKNCTNIDELIKVFSDNNIDITKEEILESAVVKNGELDDDELANVVGGIDISFIIQDLLKFIMGKIRDND